MTCKWNAPLLVVLGVVAVAIVAAFGCTSQSERAHPLEGEWKIILSTSADSGSRPKAAMAGLLLFHPAIQPIVRPPEPPAGAVLGRAYIDFGHLNTSSRPGETVSRSQADERARAGERELGEEAYALKDGADVYIEIAPLVFGFDPVLRGRLSHDRITGDWALMSHLDTLQAGHFEMVRQGRRAVIDSVLRAKRER